MISKLGHYTVGTKRFLYKIDAIRESTISKIPVKWNFHDTVYSKMDWTKPNRVDMRTLYKRRALQLRDSYDYLILYFSNGSDSQTILKTFLNNNIRLDEVFVRWPVKLAERIGAKFDTSPENLYSEWFFTIKPALEWLKNNHPSVKITIHDWTDDASTLHNKLNDDTLVKQTNTHYINYGTYLRQIHNNEFKRLDSGESIGSIFGIEKPFLCKNGNDVYCYFIDKTMAAGGDFYTKVVEPFFWTPDMPEIVMEQAHLLLDHMKLNPKLFDLIEMNNLTDQTNRNLYEEFVKQIIYPDYDLNTFQTDKHIGILSKNDLPLLNSNELTQSVGKWKSMVKNLLNGVDQEYLHISGEHTSFKTLSSQLYKIATL